MVTLTVNGVRRTLDIDPETPLLWVLRDHLGLTGTKFGCGKSQCGACTVHVDGKATRSCMYPVSGLGVREVVTIEGLATRASGAAAAGTPGGAVRDPRDEAAAAPRLHPVQEAWREHQVPQCGYCQPGQIMSAAALIDDNGAPDDEAIDVAMSGNICRCGTYQRIRAAIKTAAANRKVSR